MKTIITFRAIIILATTFFSITSYGQQSRSIDEKGLSGKKRPVKNKISVFVSGGSTMVSGKMKDSSFIGNGWNIEGGVYIPLLRSARIKSHPNSANNRMSNDENTSPDFSFGIETGISYSHQKADGGISTYNNSFRLQDGVINPSFEGRMPFASSFQIFAGPGAEWDGRKVYASPSVLLGYFSLHRQGYALSDIVANPKQATESKYIPFITSAAYSTSGFVVRPKIELGYHVTNNLAVFINGNMALGPSVQNNINYWKPQGQANDNGNYTYDQFANGSVKSTIITNNWQALSVNAGVKYTWIKHTFNSSSSKGK